VEPHSFFSFFHFFVNVRTHAKKRKNEKRVESALRMEKLAKSFGEFVQYAEKHFADWKIN